MKFGKLPNIAEIDFTLPPDPSFNEGTFNRLPKTDVKPKLFIGCTGWSMKEWVGSVYPKGTKSKDYLRHYARQFNTIELNTTHYRTPTFDTINKWYRESAPDFRFCPKILQTISHSRNLGQGGSQLLTFCESIQRLKEKLGCCFLQLPPYFGVDRLPILEAFLKNFPNHIPLAVEVRHESWFKHLDSLQRLLEMLQQYHISPVITDVAGRRDVLHNGLTTDTVLIRFVGNALHKTDYTRIDEWVGRLEKWFSKGVQQIYFFTHEPDNVLAPELSVYLYEQVQQLNVAEVRGPKLINNQAGEQMSLF